jgi:hypothetical protein
MSWIDSSSQGRDRSLRRIKMTGADKITVLNPIGYAPQITHKPLSPWLSSMDDMTV